MDVDSKAVILLNYFKGSFLEYILDNSQSSACTNPHTSHVEADIFYVSI